MNVFIRGGSIIPYQNAEKENIRTVAKLATTQIMILIALDQDNKASGVYKSDDGHSVI